MTQAVDARARRGTEQIQSDGPALLAFRILQFVFVVVPMIAGFDKFFNQLVDWEVYLAAAVPEVTGIATNSLMLTVGVIEIIAGLVVLFKPRIGGIIVAAWLAGIIINLLLIPAYFDIALRDFGLCLAAIAMVCLSKYAR